MAKKKDACCDSCAAGHACDKDTTMHVSRKGGDVTVTFDGKLDETTRKAARAAARAVLDPERHSPQAHERLMARSKELAEAAGEPDPTMERSKRLHEASQRVHAPGYACHDLCDLAPTDDPVVNRMVQQSLASAGLRPPVDEAEGEAAAGYEKQRARALHRSLGGPNSGTLARALAPWQKAQTPEEAQRLWDAERARLRKAQIDLVGTYEERQALLQVALTERYADDETWVTIEATYKDHVVYRVGDETFSAPYAAADGAVTLGEPTPVKITATFKAKASKARHSKLDEDVARVEADAARMMAKARRSKGEHEAAIAKRRAAEAELALAEAELDA